ncbi:MULTISPECIES: helix-turn-helix domain-containing protein [unclassified Arcicella]|uniref:helix-turn-helix domain-containing protein n=1 Tax=unclassified Arcicella TaxID=2644986 RepID=UPI0028590AC7|nr:MULTISPECIES: helix-turn-helix domain-containing protein [unclassified Arcicella]MDR6562866.1 AraC-like DNA-binding protein [Arcicella sp. BE51]MDR6812793.1 AraC-like DNA-binding protein [Arcicella sp. BE140]MDR6824105.1 AraC-like DNA-binding protein [Arcicella sp. BE139]
MSTQSVFTLVNPLTGHLAFKIFSFEDNRYFDHLQRNNYYTLIWIKQGNGKLKSDFSEYDFSENTLFAFSLYQPFMLSSDNISGVAIQFHPDFFCIHKHHSEIACNGVLFNNVYEPPFTRVDEVSAMAFDMLFEQMSTEMQNQALAQYELLFSYLKIYLIKASRLKKEQNPILSTSITETKEPFILQSLKDSIENNFKVKHSPSDYAEHLNISAKALAKITKTYFNKTLTDLIAERIVIEAKRELYLTNKTVKEIAFELGYDDEYYFSRFFKNNADVSPQLFRETVGFGRSMN